jgi:hypothetical protein
MPRDATREDKCSKIAKWSYLQVNGTRKNFFFTPNRLEVLNFLVSAGHIYNDPPSRNPRAHHAPRGAIPGRAHHGSYLCIARTRTGRRFPTTNLTADSKKRSIKNHLQIIIKL